MTFTQANSNYYQHNEVADAARRLLSSYHGLIFRDICDNLTHESFLKLRVDLRPSLPRRRVKLFLGALEDVAQTLKIEMTSRKYRLSFTKNYRSLMPLDRRAYRLDVLEAAQDGHSALWVNGKKYNLKQDVLHDKERFCSAWTNLLNVLRKLQVELDASSNQRLECSQCTSLKLLETTPPPPHSQSPLCQYCSTNWLEKLGLVLVTFDLMWCCFERNYISELIEIERQSKRIIMDCVHVDEELRHYEKLFMKIVIPNRSSRGTNPFSVPNSLEDFDGRIGTRSTGHPAPIHELSIPALRRPPPGPAATIEAPCHRVPLGGTPLGFRQVTQTVPSSSWASVAETATPTLASSADAGVSLAEANDDCGAAKIAEQIDTAKHDVQGVESYYNQSVSLSGVQQYCDPREVDCELFAQIRQTYTDLIACIASLNVAANARRKGRGDYTLDLFENAMCIQHRLMSKNSALSSQYLPALRDLILCQDPASPSAQWVYSIDPSRLAGFEVLVFPLLENLKNLRAFLNHIGELPEQIDPHLCQNYELVNHLANLESAWDAAKTHLSSKDTVLRLSSFLRFICQIIEEDSVMTAMRPRSVSSSVSDRERSHFEEEHSSQHPKDYAMSILRTPSPSKMRRFSTQGHTQRESLEEMIATCDVGAFLAIPKIAIIYYLIDPSLNSVNSKLLQFLLPSVFEDVFSHVKSDLVNVPKPTRKLHIDAPDAQLGQTLQNPIQKMQRLNPSISGRFETDKPHVLSIISGETVHRQSPNTLQREFFTSMRHLHAVQTTSYIPLEFQRIIQEGVALTVELRKVSTTSHSVYSETELEDAVWQYLMDRCMSTSDQVYVDSIKALKPLIESFCLALEEASIVLQRTSPAEWNFFLQTIMKCLDLMRRDDKNVFQSKNQLIAAILKSQNKTDIDTMQTPGRREASFATSPQSARLFQSSPLTTQTLDR